MALDKETDIERQRLRERTEDLLEEAEQNVFSVDGSNRAALALAHATHRQANALERIVDMLERDEQRRAL